MTPIPGERPSTEALIDGALRTAFGRPRNGSTDRTTDSTLPPERVCRIAAEIARGGMGVVYRAHDPALGREVALKLLREDLASDEGAVRRFLEEARIGGRLQHPGVVPVYALGRTATGRPWFTMKLIEGRTLASMLRARASAGEDLRRYLAILESVCRTMAFAHDAGVVHLDLKPGNIMLGAFGEVQVVDWGLAALVRSTESGGEFGPREGEVYGTPAYMPPEQARGESHRIDERADVFALGAILCEVLTGVPPHVHGYEASRQDASSADLAGALERLRTCSAIDLAEVCAACLEPDPARRRPSASDLAAGIARHFAALEERVHTAEIAAAEARVVASQERRARRLTLSLAGSILLSILLGFGVFGWISKERASRRRSVELRAGVALEEASRLLGQAESSEDLALFGRAITAAERAQSALAGGEGSPELSTHAAALIDRLRSGEATARSRAESERAQREMLARLEELRAPDEDFDFPEDAAERDQEYAEAFRRGGVDPSALEPRAFAAEVSARGIGVDVGAALDEWVDVKERACLLRESDDLRALARLVDPDPTRTRLRLDLARGAVDDLVRLLEHGDLSHLRPGTFHALARGLWTDHSTQGIDTVIRAYRVAQRTHPYDYTIAVELARKLFNQGVGSTDEGEHFYRLAQALRPDRVTPCLELGWELDHLEIDQAAAVEMLVRAVELRPSHAMSNFCLGHALRGLSDIDGAFAAQREAARLMPGDPRPHKELGMLHRLAGEPDRAIDELRLVLAIQPDYLQARSELATVLAERGHLEEALVQIRQVVAADPPGRYVWEKIEAAILIAHGDYEEAVPLLRRSLALEPESVLSLHEQGLRLQDFAQLDQLQRRCEDDLLAWPTRPDAHCRLGAVLLARGRCAEALVAFRTGHTLGSRQQAWLHPSARWVERAEHLAATESRMLEALAGRAEPRDAEEAFDFAWIAARNGFSEFAARWFAVAFEREPARASGEFARLEAACAAVMASEVAPESERAGWRSRALTWIREDLSLRRQQLEAGGEAAIQARRALGTWRVAGDLAGVRDEVRLSELPEDERAAWREAWITAATSARTVNPPRER